MKKKHLILITASFPYGLREPFLETELKYLAQHYDKIYILLPKLPLGHNHKFNFTLPPNVVVAQFDNTIRFWDRVKGLKHFFNFLFYQEIKIIKQHYKLPVDRYIIKTLLSTLIRADHFSVQLKKFLKSNRIPFHRTTCYTYWCNEYTLGIGILRKRYKLAGAFSRIHNWDLYFERAPHYYLPMRYRMFKKLDAVFPVSAQTKKYILKKVPYVNPETLFVSYLGVDKIAEPQLTGRTKTLKLLSLAFLGKIKRIDLVVAALEQLEGFNVEWHHIGEGNDHLDLKQYAFNRLFNKSNIKYVLSGDMPKKQVYEYLIKEHFDVLINTSSYEGIPVSMMEAMSFSIPVIGTAVGGVPEIIEDGKNGYLLSENPSISEIIEKLTRIHSMNDEDCQQMRLAAYNTWKNKFNAENNYSELVYNMMQLSKTN